MPSFTTRLSNLEISGPILEILIGPTMALTRKLQSQGLAVPEPVKVTAIIDTGASRTAIQQSVIHSLGIQPTGIQNVRTPSTTSPVPFHLYDIDLFFIPSRVKLSQVTAIAVPLVGQYIQALIGRDILKHGVLVYIGYQGEFTLSF
ncbi:MAG: retropepsin-like domain-containing protein [Candidatus Tectomicrobia bacterium]|nr:retropepsin-like domain-containing protein [Candidatus Tectomicrobia bacterium]